MDRTALEERIRQEFESAFAAAEVTFPEEKSEAAGPGRVK